MEKEVEQPVIIQQRRKNNNNFPIPAATSLVGTLRPTSLSSAGRRSRPTILSTGSSIRGDASWSRGQTASDLIQSTTPTSISTLGVPMSSSRQFAGNSPNVGASMRSRVGAPSAIAEEGVVLDDAPPRRHSSVMTRRGTTTLHHHPIPHHHHHSGVGGGSQWELGERTGSKLTLDEELYDILYAFGYE